MVTGVEEYFKILEELQKNNTTLPINIQSGESFFDVDLNDRLIIVPPEFKKYIAVQRDHNIETIYFRVDRYFDTTDLSELTCVVQFTNARKESGIHLVSEKDLTTYSSDGKMILGWKLNRDFTQYPGTVTYSLRFYRLDENKKFIYDLHTIPAIGIIAPGLDTLEDTNAEEDTKPVANLITDLINRVDYACGPEMNGMMKNNINEYFAENPVKEEIREYITNHQVVSDDQVDNAVHDYLTANPPTGGATNVQVEEAVNNYINNNDNSELVKQSNAIGYYYEGYVAPSTNIFDKTKIFENQILQMIVGRCDSTPDNSDVATGNAFTESTRASITKQKFKCKQGDVINVSHTYIRIAFFNTDGVVVEAMGDSTDKTFIAPEDSDYFRVSMLTDILDTFMISQNEDLPTIYEPYEVGNKGVKTYNSVPELKDRVEKLEKNQDSELVSKVKNLETIILPNINNRLETLENNAIGYYYEGHIDASTNIFDMSRVWEGYGINVGNIGGIDTMTESDDVPSGRVYKTSDVSVTTKYKIPCQENDIIRINYNWRTVAFFSEDGEMLVAYNAESYKYTAPANTAYCRVCCAISIKDKFMVTKNKDMPINYEAYQEEVIGKKTFNSIPNLKERVENLEKKTVFDKGAVLFSFDAMNTTDGRFETLNSYGFRATTNGGEVSSIKAQLKSGWDIATYSAVNWVYDTYGEQCLANDISEEIQTAWDNYVKNTVEMYEQKGVYFPTTCFCRQGKFCTGLKNALQKYGYKMARGSYYDNVNITNTAFGNDFCFNTSAFSLYPDSYVKAKEMIDYAVANKVGIVLFSHGIYETEEEATSNYGTTQAILTEICEYIKKYVDNGELEVITYHDLYSRYFPQESRELDYRRTISTLMHDWSVTE